ncbi:lactose/L-arabinose transport system permease protein [Halanaerobium saccharolyticum]|uniref:Lactose/L-arabinose transport system permease protein n=1 Tax=Halanaerobium saccharolyticum TaxID=43595 RepID=A0A4R6M254_9FIRM|nr:sugar ABC transporter permease [Halanaerobium saccharolyticum]TDO93909.1 lactose/L-arabinose transport system permease protein [Halanaerobium saccharolyticum]
MNKKYVPLMFLTPFLIFYIIFLLIPIFYAFFLSVHNWQGIGPFNFVAFENFINIFKDEVATTALINTFIMAGGTLALSLPISLLLALLINSELLPFKGFFRVVYFMPRVIALSVSGVIFLILLHTDYGVFNYILRNLGLISENIPWWQSSFYGKLGIILIRSWISIPFMMIYFLTGLQNIPVELYEAANIDGANLMQKFTFITVPMLKPIALFIFITSTVFSFQIFTIPYMITNGGPSNGTLTIIQYMFSRGLNNFEFGMASAVSVVLFVFLAVLSYIQIKIGSNN